MKNAILWKQMTNTYKTRRIIVDSRFSIPESCESWRDKKWDEVKLIVWKSNSVQVAKHLNLRMNDDLQQILLYVDASRMNKLWLCISLKAR